MSAVGFDIGNENSYIAVIKSGGIEILDNEYSLRSTPTYIGFNDRCREIGVSAKTKVITNLKNTVFGFKKILGKKYDDSDIEDELTYLPYEICQLPSGNIGIKVKYLKNFTVFSIEQLMAMILTKLKLITESKLGNKIRDCVISVPAYYTDAQRRFMLNAVNISGLNAMKLMNESTAIVLSYGYFKCFSEDKFQTVIFVDLGQSCLTVTACVFTNEKARILGCVWDHVGGRDFDNKIVQYFVDYFKSQYNVDALTSKKAIMALILECETLKKAMSANSLDVRFQIECFMNDLDVSGKMKRENFEKLSEQVLNKIEKCFYRLLKKTQLNPSDIHSVEIVGGSSRVPAVKQLVKKVFGCKPNETLNQDEAVARGCALQCAILSPSLRTRDFFVEDIPSYTIKIIWKNKESHEENLELFSLSDKVPSSKSIIISMSKPFSVEAYYVDSEENLCRIGTFVLQNIPEDVVEVGFMKVKIKACLNIHGIFMLESAEMIKRKENIDQNNKEISTVAIAIANVDLPVSEKEEKISSPEQLAEDVESSCAVESYELSIVPEVSGLTKLRLNEFINAEQQMICKDIEANEKADARNVLEEFIYEFRRKLDYELREFVTEENKTIFLQNLNDTETWLEENEELEVKQYSLKVKNLKSILDPVLKKYTEWEEISSIFDDYRQALQQGFDTLDNFMNGDNSVSCIEDDIQNLLKLWNESKEYLDLSVEKFSMLKKVDEVPFTVCDLKSSLQTFKDKFYYLFSELKKKQDIAQKKRDLSLGDRLDESSENDPKLLPKET